jgi:hypothetical protein
VGVHVYMIRLDLEEVFGEWSGLSGSGQGPVAGSCEDLDEPSGSGAAELRVSSCV